LYIPLQFWFNRNVGLALPLIALQYHEVKIIIEFASAAEIFSMDTDESSQFTLTSKAGAGSDDIESAELFVDYIYLDTDERRRFAQVSHEYLIEQVQHTGTGVTLSPGTTNKETLNFNHPVKELIWTVPAVTDGNSYTTAKLMLNGHDRFAAREEEYFQLYQPFRHHCNIPRQNLPAAAQLTSNHSTLEPSDSLGNGDLTTDAAPVVVSTDEIATPVGANTFCLLVTSAPFSTVTADAVATASGDGATPAAGLNAAVTAENWAAQTITGKAAIQVTDANGAFWSQYVGRPIQLTGTNLLQAPGDATLGTTVDVVLSKVVVAANANVTTGAINDGTLLYFNKNFLNITGTGVTNTTVTAAKAYLPDLNLAKEASTSKMTRSINCYSFGLKPEEHQPSGTCNFSRIDNAMLQFGQHGTLGNDTKLNIYAVSYNVLRIMSGMGGLAYSN
jgi:hypothetical protein